MIFATIPILQQLQSLSAGQGFAVITEIGSYVSNIVSLILIVATLAAFIFLVYGGLQWIMSGPDKTKLEEAKPRLTNAFIGLTIVAASWAIFLLLNYFFGLGLAGNSGSSTTNNRGSTGTTCLYPTRRCCDNVSDSTCFCQNASYRAVTQGSCDAGGGQTGVLCSCERP